MGGCKELSNNINKNLSAEKRLELFIKKGKELYKDRFSYDYIKKDLFKNNKSKIILKCKKHGIFETNFSEHFSRISGGCPLCSKNIGSKFSLDKKKRNLY